MSGLVYQRPSTLADATRFLADTENSYPLAGGTDLAVAMRHGNTSPALMVDIKGIPELRSSITCADGMFEISANTAMTDLENDETVRRKLPGLVESAQVVGSVQIRNRATFAGNLCNGSPAADTPPVLMALGASVVIQGPSGERTSSIDDLLVGYRATTLAPGELITAVHVPEPPGRGGSAFLKLGVRRAMEISVVCVGASIDLADDGTIASAGLALGSVGPQTLRAAKAEKILAGSSPSEALFAAASQTAGEECTPIDDLRATGEYRKAMVPVLVRRALGKAHERARETG